MVSTEIVNSKVFDELEKIIYQQLLGNTDAKLYIIPKFNLQNNLNALDIIEKYRDNIEWEIQYKENDMLMLVLFKELKISFEDNEIILTAYNKFMSEFRGKNLIEFLKRILFERFNIKVNVKIEVEENPEILEEYLKNKELEEKRLAKEYVIQNPTPQPTVKQSVEVKKPSIKRTDKARKPKDVNLIYGKNVDGELLRIEELNNFEGEAVIRGCVVSYLERNLKQPDKKLVILSVTDFTDTIEVKIFIKLRQLSDISEFIQKAVT